MKLIGEKTYFTVFLLNFIYQKGSYFKSILKTKQHKLKIGMFKYNAATKWFTNNSEI